MRRLLPILIANALVIMTIAMIIVTKPNYARAVAVVMLMLFVANFVFFRKIQKEQTQALASGTATPQSPAKMRAAMWALGLYGAASFVSGAFDLPELLAQNEFGPWLGWSVKMAVGSLSFWCAFRVRNSLKPNPSKTDQPN